MNGYSSGNGQPSEDIRRKLRSCRRALRARTFDDGAALASAVAEVFSIDGDGLPAELRPGLLSVRQLLLGDVIKAENRHDRHDGQDGRFRSLIAAMPLPDQMRLTQALLAFCSECESKLRKQKMGDGKP